MWGDVVGMADKQPRSNALDTRVLVHPTPVHYVVKLLKSIPTPAVPSEVVLASSLPTISREGATACGIVRKPGDIISVVLNPID